MSTRREGRMKEIMCEVSRIEKGGGEGGNIITGVSRSSVSLLTHNDFIARSSS